jgi:hypothetical protein
MQVDWQYRELPERNRLICGCCWLGIGVNRLLKARRRSSASARALPHFLARGWFDEFYVLKLKLIFWKTQHESEKGEHGNDR